MKPTYRQCIAHDTQAFMQAYDLNSLKDVDAMACVEEAIDDWVQKTGDDLRDELGENIKTSLQFIDGASPQAIKESEKNQEYIDIGGMAESLADMLRDTAARLYIRDLKQSIWAEIDALERRALMFG